MVIEFAGTEGILPTTRVLIQVPDLSHVGKDGQVLRGLHDSLDGLVEPYFGQVHLWLWSNLFIVQGSENRVLWG